MVLTTLMALALCVLGLFGLFRGVRRGVISLAGTLLGAVLVDLWQERWSAWLRTQVETPAWPTFLLTATIFLLVALLVGYGGSMLLAQDPKAKPPGLPDRLLGLLVGALNGALIVSYLLRYAGESWPKGEVTTLIATSMLAGVLSAWLPWFILAMVATTAVFVLLRSTVRVSRALNTRPVPTVPAPKSPLVKPAGVVVPPAAAPAAPPKSLAEADRRLLEKISQAPIDKK